MSERKRDTTEDKVKEREREAKNDRKERERDTKETNIERKRKKTDTCKYLINSRWSERETEICYILNWILD